MRKDRMVLKPLQAASSAYQRCLSSVHSPAAARSAISNSFPMVRHSRERTEDPSSDSDYADKPTARKRRKPNAHDRNSHAAHAKKTAKAVDCSSAGSPRQENSDSPVSRRHPKLLHKIQDVNLVREALLRWFAGVHDSRPMPWRKRYNPHLGPEERAQRAYEVSCINCLLLITEMNAPFLGLGIRNHASANTSRHCYSLLYPLDGKVRGAQRFWLLLSDAPRRFPTVDRLVRSTALLYRAIRLTEGAGGIKYRRGERSMERPRILQSR